MCILLPKILHTIHPFLSLNHKSVPYYLTTCLYKMWQNRQSKWPYKGNTAKTPKQSLYPTIRQPNSFISWHHIRHIIEMTSEDIFILLSVVFKKPLFEVKTVCKNHIWGTMVGKWVVNERNRDFPSLILYHENTKRYCSYRQRKLSIFINKYIFKFLFL